jgi:Spy/CpxP family protein refolding chaperone
VKALHEQQREAVRPLAEQMRPLHEQLRELLQSDSADAAAVGQQMLAIRALQKEIGAVHASFREKLVALLTPEQVEKLEAAEAGRGPRGRGPGMGPGLPLFGPPPPPEQ